MRQIKTRLAKQDNRPGDVAWHAGTRSFFPADAVSLGFRQNKTAASKINTEIFHYIGLLLPNFGPLLGIFSLLIPINGSFIPNFGPFIGIFALFIPING